MTEEFIVNVVIPLVPLVCAIITSIVAIIKGVGKRKTTSKLTIEEQTADLFAYMVEECKVAERNSKLLVAMSKDDLSQWKHNEVMKNVTLYAKANNYSWYNKDEWNEKLKKYISDANAVSGKQNTVI